MKNPKRFFIDSKYYPLNTIAKQERLRIDKKKLKAADVKRRKQIAREKMLAELHVVASSGALDEARTKLEQFWSDSPWKLQTVLLWTTFYQRECNFSEAIRMLDIAINRAPHWKLLLQRSRVRRAMGCLSDELLDDIEAALKLKPKEQQLLRYYVGLQWSTKGVSPQLISTCQYLEKQGKNNTPADLLRVAAIYDEAGRYTLASRRFNEALSQDPSVLERVQYLPLLASMHRLTVSTEEITRLARQYSDYVESRRGDFEDRIRKNHHSFCVVGNGPSNIGSNQGSAIDRNNIVIRFNAFDTTFPHCDDYGSKTTHWVKAGDFVEVPRKKVMDLESILISGYNSFHRNTMGLDLVHDAILEDLTVEFIPTYIYEDLFEELKATPSAGIAILYWIYKIAGPIERSRVFGFSFGEQPNNKSEHYFINRKKSTYYVHDWRAEGEMLKKITFIQTPKRASPDSAFAATSET